MNGSMEMRSKCMSENRSIKYPGVQHGLRLTLKFGDNCKLSYPLGEARLIRLQLARHRGVSNSAFTS